MEKTSVVYPLNAMQWDIYDEWSQNHATTEFNMVMAIEEPCSKVSADRLCEVCQQVLDSQRYLHVHLVDSNDTVMVSEDWDVPNTVVRMEMSDAEWKSGMTSVIQPFDLFHEPAVRLHVIAAETKSVMVVETHRLFFDYASHIAVWLAIHDALHGKEIFQQEDAARDFNLKEIAAYNSESYQQVKGFLEDFPDEIRFTDICRDTDAPWGKTISASQFVPADIIGSGCVREGVSYDVIFHAAYAMALGQMAGEQKVMFYGLYHGRDHSLNERVYGNYQDCLPILINIDPQLSESDFLQQVRVKMLLAMRHKDYPLYHMLRDFHIGGKGTEITPDGHNVREFWVADGVAYKTYRIHTGLTRQHLSAKILVGEGKDGKGQYEVLVDGSDGLYTQEQIDTLTRLTAEYAVRLATGDLKSVFRNDTQREADEMEKRLKAAFDKDEDEIRQRDLSRLVYPMNAMQWETYDEWNQNRAMTEYNIVVASELPRDKFDPNRISDGCQKVLDSQRYLHAHLVETDGTVMVSEDWDLPNTVVRWEMSDAEWESNKASIIRPFDVFREPSVRIHVISTETRVVLAVETQHILFDGTSHKAVWFAINDALHGREICQQGDAARNFNQNETDTYDSAPYQRAKQYYKEHVEVNFTDICRDTDSPWGKTISTSQFASADAIDAGCVREGVSFAVVFNAAYALALGQMAGEQKVLFYSVNHGRDRKLHERVYGNFLSCLPVLIDTDYRQTVTDLLRQTKTQMFISMRNKAYPLYHMLRDLQLDDIGTEISPQGRYIREGWVLDGVEYGSYRINTDLTFEHISAKILIREDENGANQYEVFIDASDGLYTQEQIDTLGSLTAEYALKLAVADSTTVVENIVNEK